MLEVLTPKVHEERHNKKCVIWAADSFLFNPKPDVHSFKANPRGTDIKATLLSKRKQK